MQEAHDVFNAKRIRKDVIHTLIKHMVVVVDAHGDVEQGVQGILDHC